MHWEPNYTITNRLLLAIREIGEAMGELRHFNLSGGVLAKLAGEARALSTYASTSIEGNPLPLTDVKRLLKTKKAYIRDTEREVLNYNQALEALYAGVKSGKFELSIQSLARVQKQVVAGLMDNPAHCGQLRQEPVVIRNPKRLDEIVFMPPDAKEVRPLMRGLIDFVQAHRETIDPVILAGLFHRQCVIIHPFMDGNGRATRLLTTALLGMAGLNFFEIFSFEHYYNSNLTRYFEAVGLIGDYYDLQNEIDFTQWLEYFAEGILDELSRLRKAVPALITAERPMPRLEDHHRQILDYIGKHGILSRLANQLPLPLRPPALSYMPLTS